MKDPWLNREAENKVRKKKRREDYFTDGIEIALG